MTFGKRVGSLLPGPGYNPLDRSARYAHFLPSFLLSEPVAVTQAQRLKLISEQFNLLQLAHGDTDRFKCLPAEMARTLPRLFGSW